MTTNLWRVYAHADMAEERIAAAKTIERVVLEITGATGSTGKESGRTVF